MTSKFTRPTAVNYKDKTTQRETLSAKADSVFSYRGVNPYSLAFDKFKRDNNENLDETLWQEAANNGELDQYISMLSKNNNKSQTLSDLTEHYGSKVDYDTKMLALAYDTIEDSDQKNQINVVLNSQKVRWDNELIQEEKESAGFWKKIKMGIQSTGVEIGAFATDMASGGIRVAQDGGKFIAATSYTIAEFMSGRANSWSDINKHFTQGVAIAENKQGVNTDLNLGKQNSAVDIVENLDDQLTQLAYEMRRNYSLTVDAITGEYNFVGKTLQGMADSIGYMSLAFVAGPAGMYVPMFTGNVSENYSVAGSNVNYNKIIANAGLKAGAEFAIEYALNKFLGSTVVNRLIGFSDDTAKIATKSVTKGLTTTGKQALSQTALTLAKESLQEGLEEVLQDTSSNFIDYLYGDQYKERAKDNFTIENLSQAFIVGAFTSIAMSSAQIAVTKKLNTVNTDNEVIKLGKVQSYNYAQSLATMQEWQNLMNDSKADPTARVEAGLKLEAVTNSLSKVYESLGIENVNKIDTLLNNIHEYQQRKSAIEDSVKKGDYSSMLLSNLDNEVDGKNWIEAFNKLNQLADNVNIDINATQRLGVGSEYTAFTKALKNSATQMALANGKTSTIKTPLDSKSIDETSGYAVASKLGFKVVVPTNGRDIVMSDDVLFVPEEFERNANGLLKGIVAQRTIIRVLENIPADLQNAVLNTYKESITKSADKYTEAELAMQAIGALVFDKDFQLKMLLKTKENNNTWGTDIATDFILNLKKMVAKTYNTTKVDGKTKRTLTQATKTLTNKMITNLQEAIVVMNTTSKRVDVNESALTTEQKAKIKNNRNVIFSQTLDNIFSANTKITPKLEKFIENTVKIMFNDKNNRFEPIISAISDIRKIDKPTVSNITEGMLHIITNGTPNQKSDLNANLSYHLQLTDLYAKNKITYVPLSDSNLPLFKTALQLVKQIETQALGGQSIVDVISGKANYNLIDNAVLNQDAEFKNNEFARYTVINNGIKNASNNEFAILNNGLLIKTGSNENHLKPEVLNKLKTDSLEKVLTDMAGKNKSLKLQDFFQVDLGSVIGNTPVIFTFNNENISGYHKDGGLISINFGKNYNNLSNLIVVLHESVHAVRGLTMTDSRYLKLRGDHNDLAAIIPDAIVGELSEYLKTNFPITYNSVFPDDKARLGIALYLLFEEEVAAREIDTLNQISTVGFKFKITKDNVVSLIAPDGKKAWALNKVEPLEITDFNDFKLNLNKLNVSDLSNHMTIDLKQSENKLEAKELIQKYYIESLELSEKVSDNFYTKVEEITNTLNDTISKSHEINPYEYKLLISKLRKPGLFNIDMSKIESYSKNTLKTVIGQLNMQITKLTTILQNNKKKPQLIKSTNTKENIKVANSMLEYLIDQYTEVIIKPLTNLYDIQNLRESFLTITETTESNVDNFTEPKSFNFGPYSFTKHTANSYMLTKRDSSGRYQTQAVDKDTLMPIRTSQKPILNDSALRNRFLLVISKKIEKAEADAKNTKKSKEVKSESDVVWEWGQWSIREYDDTHYTVTKNASSEAGDDFKQIQIVSKDTLLPDGMFGGSTKAILSKSERSNLLDYIEHDTTPIVIKQKDKVTGKDKYKFIPNLSDKVTTDSTGQEVSKEQLEFFKDTKVRDDDYKLLRVYHGTNNDFKEFDIDVSKSKAFYFTNSKDIADSYSNHEFIENGAELTLADLYKGLKDAGYELIEKYYNPNEIVQYGNSKVKASELIDDYYNNSDEVYKALTIYDKQASNLTGGFVIKKPDGSLDTNLFKYTDDNDVLSEAAIQYSDILSSTKTLSGYLNILKLYEVPADMLDESNWQDDVEEYAIKKGYDGFVVRDIVDVHLDDYIGNNQAADIYGIFKSNQFKLATNTKPTDNPGIDKFAAPDYSKNRQYISNKKAAKSNLKYFIRKGKPIQLHTDVATFIEATTADFDKLSKYFKVRIEKGQLTKHDIINYVATAKSINAYTWKAIAKHIYHNDIIAQLGPNLAKFFLDSAKLEKYAIMSRLTDDVTNNEQLRLIDFKRLEQNFDAQLEKGTINDEFIKTQKAVQTWWQYNTEGKLVKQEVIIDENQLLPIFMNHFDGTLASLDDIFTLAKTLAGKQLLKSRLGESSNELAANNKKSKISSGNAAVENNTVGVKGKSDTYKWLDNIRKNVIDYEITGYEEVFDDMSKTLEDLSNDEKYTIVQSYLYNEAISYTNNPTQQDEYEANLEVEEALNKMTTEELNKLLYFIVDSNIDKTSTVDSEVAQDGPSTKNLKDGLRNQVRRLIRNLAGSKVSYNHLPNEVKSLINFSTNSTINKEAYTNLSNEELIKMKSLVVDEVNKLKEAHKLARNQAREKAALIRKVKALQNKEKALAEREAQIKARKKALKEGKTLSQKINLVYETAIDNTDLTINGPSKINDKLLTILNHTWDKTTTSKVKYMNDSVQTIQNIHNAEEFYKEHAEELNSMVLNEIEDVTDWLIHSNINTTDSVARQTFEATRFFILAYIYNETSAVGQFKYMNNNLKQQLGNFLKGVQTSAGTLLSLVTQVKKKLNPAAVIATELLDRFEFKLDDQTQDKLNTAIGDGDTAAMARILTEIKNDAVKSMVPEKATTLRKVAAIRSMSMISSPMTWLRNINSNIMLTGLNRFSAKIGHAIFPKLTAKTDATKSQYKLDQKVTKEIQTFIEKQFIESGFFDETLDQLSKYNPSQVLRHKRAGEYDVIGDMLIHSIYNQYYSESMFDSKMLNNIHTFLMKRLSDKNFVRKAAVKYIGKLLAETNAHLDSEGNIKTSIDKPIMRLVADGYALATRDYMHSDNAFSHIERWLDEHSKVAWAGYKLIMPFATASWNWFKGAAKYTPVGLGQAIVRLTKLEQEIIHRESMWQKGDEQVAPELASYIVRRDLGSGIIGTTALIFGMMLAAFGYISLEDDDWGIPKLAIGNLHIDISSIFGTSSVLAGAALIETMKNKDLNEGLDAMIEPLVNGFFFTDLLSLDANSPQGWFEWSTYQLQSTILSFIPSGVRYLSGMTYTGTYKTNNLFERSVTRLPFLGQAFNIEKKTNIYTGDSDGTFWDILHRAFPYFEVVTKTNAEKLTEEYGLSKSELKGTYVINGEEFTTNTKETARINKLYGTLNSETLIDFYSNKTSYKVLTANNTYRTKTYSQMTDEEIANALDQIFSTNSTIAKASAWLEAGHTYYTNNQTLFNKLRSLGYSNVYKGSKGFVD